MEPLLWERGVLANGPPGKPLELCLKMEGLSLLNLQGSTALKECSGDANKMSIDSETGCIKFKVISLEVRCNLHTVGTTGDSLLTKTNKQTENKETGRWEYRMAACSQIPEHHHVLELNP